MRNFEIEKYSPCKEAINFREQYASFEEAWNNCPRGDWMLWIAQKVGVNLQTLTLAKALCANTVRHLMKDERSRNAIDVALRFGNNQATIEELDAAAYDAYAAAYAAYDAYDATYADAAVDTAAAYAADTAAYTADDTAAYADAADTAAIFNKNKNKNRLETANICREILTEEVFKLINK